MKAITKSRTRKMIVGFGLSVAALMVTAFAGVLSAIDAPGLDPVTVPIEAQYLGDWGGGKHMDLTGSALPGATVVVIVRTQGNRYDQDPVIAGSDGRFVAKAGIYGSQGQEFHINAYQMKDGDYSPESSIQNSSLHLSVPTPAIDAVPNTIETNYLGTWGGGKDVDITGSGLPGGIIVPIVRTQGNRYDQDTVVVGADGRFTAKAKIYGGQGQSFEINAYQKLSNDYSPESPVGNTSLHLLMPAPAVDAIPSEVLGEKSAGGVRIAMTGTAFPGSEVIGVVVTAGQRFDHPAVVAGADGRYSTEIGILGQSGQSFEVFAYSKIGNDAGPESAHQTTMLKFPVSAPVVDAVANIIEADYAGAWGGGKDIDMTGSCDAGATVIAIVRTQGNRYDQDPVVAGSDGRFTAKVKIYGAQGQSFEINAYAKVGSDFGPESSIQTSSLKLLVPAPTVDAVPPTIEGDRNAGGQRITITGSAVPGSEVIGVVVTAGQRFDHPAVVAGADGRYSTEVGILGSDGQSFELFAYAKVGNDIGSESNRQTTLLQFPPENQPPAANAGTNQTVECAGALTAVVLDGSASSDPNNDPLTYNWSENGQPIAGGVNPTVNLALGAHTITLAVNDGKVDSAPSTVVVTIHDTTPPQISAPADVTVEYGSAVNLGLPAVSDAADSNPSVTNDTPATYSIGTTVVTWTAKDASGNTSTAQQKVTVQDTTPPAISVNDPLMSSIWSPNHKMMDVTITGAVSDSCAPAVQVSAIVNVVDVAGEFAENDPDYQVANITNNNGQLNAVVSLRAERAGAGVGRTYEIIFSATDASGNSSSAKASVLIPHDMGDNVEVKGKK